MKDNYSCVDNKKISLFRKGGFSRKIHSEGWYNLMTLNTFECCGREGLLLELNTVEPSINDTLNKEQPLYKGHGPCPQKFKSP